MKMSEVVDLSADTNDKIKALCQVITGKEEEITRLKSELAWFKRQMFGSKRERLPKEQPDNQLTLFDKSQSKDIDDADLQLAEDAKGLKPGSDIPVSPPSVEGSSDQPQKRNGRKRISSAIETQEEVIPVADEDKVDEYGEQLTLVGYSTYEQLIRVPGKLVRKLYKRERYGYKDTREIRITADHKPSIIPRGKYGDEFIHETAYQKFYLGMPLYRQLLELHTIGGGEINKSTMSDMIRYFAEFYAPVCDAIRTSILKSPFVHADESPLIQLLRDGKLKGYLWAFKDADQIYYAYAPKRSGDVAEDFFMSKDPPDAGEAIFVRYLMTDGYAPYIKVAELIGATRMNCWAHARRKFYNAALTNDEAKILVKIIDRMYRIERRVNAKAQREKWSYTKLVAARFKARRSKSAKFIQILEKKLHEIQIYATPKSALGKACSYCIKNLEAQKVYLTDGRLPIDNNTVERSIRPVAVGRKNFMFVGSEDAGEWAAICYTIMENCRMNKLDPRKYMDYVTKQIHAQGRDSAEYDLLTPLAIAEKLGSPAL